MEGGERVSLVQWFLCAAPALPPPREGVVQHFSREAGGFQMRRGGKVFMMQWILCVAPASSSAHEGVVQHFTRKAGGFQMGRGGGRVFFDEQAGKRREDRAAAEGVGEGAESFRGGGIVRFLEEAGQECAAMYS